VAVTAPVDTLELIGVFLDPLTAAGAEVNQALRASIRLRIKPPTARWAFGVSAIGDVRIGHRFVVFLFEAQLPGSRALGNNIEPSLPGPTKENRALDFDSLRVQFEIAVLGPSP